MLKKTLHYLLMTSLLLSVGCIHEEIENCAPGVKLQFFYSHNTKELNLFNNEVNKMTVYVFDKNDLYYGSYTDQGNHLTDSYGMVLPLPKGEYKIVSWGGPLTTYDVIEANSNISPVINGNGNIGNDNSIFSGSTKAGGSLTVGSTKLQDFRLLINQNSNKAGDVHISKNIDDLYFGDITTVQTSNVKSVSAVVGLIKNTNLIKMIINNRDMLDNGGAEIEVSAISQNGSYNWDNSVDKSFKSVSYTPFKTTLTTKTQESQLRVLRLLKGESLKLTVKDPISKVILFDHNIVDLILQNPIYKTQTDIDREDEFVFNVDIREDLTVSITINGWKVVIIKPGQN